MRATYLSILNEVRVKGAIIFIAEWLLHNLHVADEIFRHLCCNPQPDVCRSLPPLQFAEVKGYPAVLHRSFHNTRYKRERQPEG